MNTCYYGQNDLFFLSFQCWLPVPQIPLSTGYWLYPPLPTSVAGSQVHWSALHPWCLMCIFPNILVMKYVTINVTIGNFTFPYFFLLIMFIHFVLILQLADHFCNSIGVLQQSAPPGKFPGFDKQAQGNHYAFFVPNRAKCRE